jgi:hypothetical protein
MRVGLKLFRLLALMACVSLVLAGGHWVHHTHAEAPHFHDETHLIEDEHVNMDRDGGDNGAPFESFIHCGSDLVWISELQNPRTCAVTHARAGGYLKPVIPVYLKVEKPPPRLIAS